MKVRREHRRIYFGEGAERWSVCDPVIPDDEEPTNERARGMAGDIQYLAVVCPDTETALEKLALIRWAVRNVKAGEAVEKRRTHTKREKP